ncbi:MAG: PAS domain S-box protein [Desulfobacteraceae bacterium]|nr:PAS domain S-box protein [Desulfobacteraceae bacterium]
MNIKEIINPRTIAGAALLNVILAITAMTIIFEFFLTYKMHKLHNETIKKTEQRYTQFYKKIISNDIENVDNFIKYKRSNTEKRVRESLKNHVLNAYSVAEHLYSMNQKTNQNQLILDIKEALRPIHWGNKECFFIINNNGSYLLNTSKPELETIVLPDAKLSNENLAMVRITENKESGFYKYKTKKTSEDIVDSFKIAFIKKFEALGWVLGAGIHLSDTEINTKNEVLDRIAEMGKSRNRYVFVLQNNGFCLYHPLEEFNKKFVLDYTSRNGEKVIANLIDTAINKKNDGYYQYSWKKPSSGRITPKMSFVKHIKDWNWTIGTGVYLDEMRQIIDIENKQYIKELKNSIFIIILMSLIAILLPLSVGVFITDRFNKSISTFINFFKDAAVSDTMINMEELQFKEFKFIGSLANQLVIDRMQKEIALEQSFSKTNELKILLNNVTDSMPSSIITVDMKMKVVQWNKKAERITGIHSTKAEGKSIEECFPLSDSEISLIRKTLKTGKASAETKVKRKDENSAEPIYEDIFVFPLISDKTNGGVIRVDDVTEKVKMEEMVIQSEKMLSVGGLAAGMAHEINNPLSGILTSTQVLENRLINDLPANIQAAEECGTTFETVKDYINKRDLTSVLEHISSSGARAATIVSDMLSFSRKSESVFERCNIIALMDKTIELAATDYDLKTKFDFKKINITRNYSTNMPEIKCDSGKIQQVFLNILINGAHAMAEMSNLNKPEFSISINHKTEMLEIEIHDNGPGIPSDIQGKIFEPFFSTKAIGVGTGLGLSVSYFIIKDLHKGTLDVNSKEGKGTSFIICIPV